MKLTNIYPHISLSGNTEVVINSSDVIGEPEGFCFHFYLHEKLTKRDALKEVQNQISRSEINWIDPKKSKWIVNAVEAKKHINYLAKFEWFDGILYIDPDLDVEETSIFDEIKQESVYRLYVLKDDVLMDANKKVFLSHKGVNKELVKEYNNVLMELGYETWLDEDAMKAGENPDRSIQKGFKESCAAIFFVTPDYKDEGWLADEIEYALIEKRDKKDKFHIITLVLSDNAGDTGNVPELLKRFIWKTPKNDLDGLREIIRAIPLKLSPPMWPE